MIRAGRDEPYVWIGGVHLQRCLGGRTDARNRASGQDGKSDDQMDSNSKGFGRLISGHLIR